jgi:hypothetical protein
MMSAMSTALAAAEASTRLKAALAIGSHPDPGLLYTLVTRCAIEPDFYVRDMLTWALTRFPAEATLPTCSARKGRLERLNQKHDDLQQKHTVRRARHGILVRAQVHAVAACSPGLYDFPPEFPVFGRGS